MGHLFSDSKFESYVMPEPMSGCWLWLGLINGHGYGKIYDRPYGGTSKMVRAHRVSYEITYGVKLTARQCVLHKCDNPLCVNPDHLRVGTHKENTHDMMRKGRGGWQRDPVKWANGPRGPRPKSQGENSHCAKLTVAKVIEIRRLCADGHSQVKIANDFGISPPTVNNIYKRRFWRHVV